MPNKIISENIKLWLENLKLLGIIVIISFLVFDPPILKKWCSDGGFSECNFFGNKLTNEQEKDFQKSAQDTGEMIFDSKVQLSNLQKNISDLEDTLKKISPSLDDRTGMILKDQIAKAEQTTSVLTSTINEHAKNVEILNTVVDQFKLIGSWAIVFGGDPRHKDALTEIKKAKEAGFLEAKVLFRQKSFRSVIFFPSRSSAQSALEKIVSLSYQKDAYIVNLDIWCPNKLKSSDADGDFIECE
ncbi:MAG: hypothetical protein PHN45_03265 [Methylococcales bacterium]|nr:hypothetical protein [Methylococcales bacterium]